MTQENTINQFLSARKVSTPIIAIETPDQGATFKGLLKVLGTARVYGWDAVQGLRICAGIEEDEHEAEWAVLLASCHGEHMATMNPTIALSCVRNIRLDSCVVMFNIQRHYDDPGVAQAIWNLRDLYKAHGKTLVLLVPECRLPNELRHDVVVLREPLPESKELAPMVENLVVRAKDSCPDFPDLDSKTLDAVTSSLAGLSMQQAEQVAAMSLRKTGIDLSTLRTNQRRQVEQTPGLSIVQSDSLFSNLHGMDSLVGFMECVIKGKRKPKTFVFVDEIEKAFAGAFGLGDSSGTSQEQHGYILQHMQDTNARGIILVGGPGTGKSELAKASGNEGDCWTVQLDLGGMKGSLVGESGAMTRRALDVVDALGQGECFWIATCNSIESLPPELRRRFSYGTWYVEQPNEESRANMWHQYRKRFDCIDDSKPAYAIANSLASEYEGWTGAEIRTCCSMSADLGISIWEASKYISPVYRSNAESIARIEQLAAGRFLSARNGGLYKNTKVAVPDGLINQVTGERIISMDES